MTLSGSSAAARLNMNCETFFKFDIMEFVFQNFLFSGVCLVRSLSFRSLSFQEFVFTEFVFQEFVFQEFVTAPNKCLKINQNMKHTSYVTEEILKKEKIEDNPMY